MYQKYIIIHDDIARFFFISTFTSFKFVITIVFQFFFFLLLLFKIRKVTICIEYTMGKISKFNEKIKRQEA